MGRGRGLGRMIRILMAVLALPVALTLAGCSVRQGPETGKASMPQEDAPLQIGLSFDSFVIERWTRDREVFVSTAEELGAAVNVQNANGDIEKQISQIEYFIKKKMDVIVIIAIDGDSLVDVVKQARSEGISVVCYDRLIRNADTDLYISFDNEQVGVWMGQALKEALPEGGRVFCIYGSPSDNNVSLVIKGLKAALKGEGPETWEPEEGGPKIEALKNEGPKTEALKNEGPETEEPETEGVKKEPGAIEIVYEAWCDNWLAELAFEAVEEGLEQEGSVDGVMCGNDDLASQAIKALAEHRLAGRVPVVAQDAELSACQRIVEGTQTMTVFKSVDELARQAAILSVALGKGEDITAENAPLAVTETMDDGSFMIPYYRIEPVPVTKQNMDQTIIASGFHRKEDVYLNVP